ncbi:MAG: hypothetical protein LBN05_05160, partial [Oscillospiraceae bacterium]|nr:hypothetical protein [Oscillospiraceae bacterium]
ALSVQVHKFATKPPNQEIEEVYQVFPNQIDDCVHVDTPLLTRIGQNPSLDDRDCFALGLLYHFPPPHFSNLEK